MKKILLGLALTGLIQLSAQAQAKYCSKYDQNFKVAKSENGYTINGQLPASCNGGSVATKGNVTPTETYPYTTSNATTGKHSKFDKNYPICMHKNGYTVCTEQEAMNQPATYAKPVYLNGDVPKKDCNCVEEHNGMTVSYNDRTICTNIQKDEE